VLLFAGSVEHSVVVALKQIAVIWLVVVALEVAMPRGGQVHWRRRAKGLLLGLLYWTLAGASFPVTGLIVHALGIRPLFDLHAAPRSVGAYLLYASAGTLIGLLSFEFLYYWFHRLQHTRLMWRFHAVHHAIEDVDALNAYPHWTEEASRLPFVVLPTALLVPVGLPALPWGIWSALHSVYIHSQSRVNLGPFWRLCMDNRFHRLHHSREERHFDKNFGLTTPLWDWMFGTLYVPAKDEWPETGLADQREISGVGDFLWRPFRTARRA
jgi:sterol desaturase/sphingolipid hydroxylase (fatty acid hydroxylase superfamily)